MWVDMGGYELIWINMGGYGKMRIYMAGYLRIRIDMDRPGRKAGKATSGHSVNVGLDSVLVEEKELHRGGGHHFSESQLWIE